MAIKLNKTLITIILVLNLFFVFTDASAANLGDAFTTQLTPVANSAGYKKDVDVLGIASVGINLALSILGVIFLILFIYAGYNWMMSRGNEQMLEKAKDTMTAAIIGMIIVVAAYAISFFVVSKLTSATLNSSSGSGSGKTCAGGWVNEDGSCSY